MAKVGFQPSGGMILAMPYFAPSGAILRIYSMGSLNSSAVGLKVGASGILCSLFLFVISGAAPFSPRLSTVERSNGAERRALSGIGALLRCAGVPGVVALAGILPFEQEDVDDEVALTVGVFDAMRIVVAEAAALPVPLLGGTTMAAALCAQLARVICRVPVCVQANVLVVVSGLQESGGCAVRVV